MNPAPRWMRYAPAFALATMAPALAAQQPAALPDSVRAHIRARVDAGWTPSIVVGMVDSSGDRYYAYGRTAAGGGSPVHERTIYEIGSITKVFTSLLLADMAVRGEVGLDDPVRRYLPDSVAVPGTDSQPITLRLLAAQRSGLPRLPPGFAPSDPNNPYADYDAGRLYEFLRTYTLTRAPGAAYEYSNLGAGLLGFVLARRARMSYEETVRRRILWPLGMTSTMITLNSQVHANLARGSADGQPARAWNFDALAGAGALRSTAVDMTAFLAAAMGLRRTPLDSAFRLAAEPRFDAGPGGVMRIGLGWHVRDAGTDSALVWHNGGTGGYHSYAGFVPSRGTAVVVLANSPANIDDIGISLLDPSSPMPQERMEVAVTPAVLERYVGAYELTPQFVIEVTLRANRLYVQATGQPEFPIYASSDSTFFLRVVEAALTFQRDSAGTVTGVVLHQNGRNAPGRKTR